MFNVKILYAEDNEKIRQSYVQVLKFYFKDVIEASNGKEALALYEKHKPHILLMDINMPLMDGLELIQIVREKDQTSKIIVLSAYSDHDKLMKAIPLNLSAYLIKPIKSEAFKKVLMDVASDIEALNQIELPNGVIFDKDTRTLLQNDESIELTSFEFSILELLIEKYNPVSYDDISLKLWNCTGEFNHTKIQNIIKRLRKKLPELIESVNRFGYHIKR